LSLLGLKGLSELSGTTSNSMNNREEGIFPIDNLKIKNTSSKNIKVSNHGGYFQRKLYLQVAKIAVLLTLSFLVVFSVSFALDNASLFKGIAHAFYCSKFLRL